MMANALCSLSTQTIIQEFADKMIGTSRSCQVKASCKLDHRRFSFASPSPRPRPNFSIMKVPEEPE